MVSSNLLLAKYCFSNAKLKGIGVSNEAQRIMGASKYAKQCSEIQALIYPPIPPVKLSSCRIQTLPVAFTTSRIASSSKGAKLRKSKMLIATAG